MVTLAIDAMGIGLILPVMPDLIREVDGGGNSEAAIWGGILATSFAVMQFLFGPAIGSLSDRLGRRPVPLVSLAVMAADYIVMAMVQGASDPLIIPGIGEERTMVFGFIFNAEAFLFLTFVTSGTLAILLAAISKVSCRGFWLPSGRSP